MAILTPERIQPRNPAQRGRPVAVETFAEQVEGLAMGVVAETGFGNRHIAKASIYDRLGDNTRQELWALLDEMHEAFIEGRRSDLAAGFQVIDELRKEIERLDSLEDREYRHEAPGHVGAAYHEGREIIGLCQ